MSNSRTPPTFKSNAADLAKYCSMKVNLSYGTVEIIVVKIQTPNDFSKEQQEGIGESMTDLFRILHEDF